MSTKAEQWAEVKHSIEMLAPRPLPIYDGSEDALWYVRHHALTMAYGVVIQSNPSEERSAKLDKIRETLTIAVKEITESEGATK